jgi:hypothetical protein
MFVMRAAVGVEANPWTGGKVALAHKEFSNTAEVSRKVREDSILREILSRGLPSVCVFRFDEIESSAILPLRIFHFLYL